MLHILPFHRGCGLYTPKPHHIDLLTPRIAKPISLHPPYNCTIWITSLRLSGDCYSLLIHKYCLFSSTILKQLSCQARSQTKQYKANIHRGSVTRSLYCYPSRDEECQLYTGHMDFPWTGSQLGFFLHHFMHLWLCQGKRNKSVSTSTTGLGQDGTGGSCICCCLLKACT